MLFFAVLKFKNNKTAVSFYYKYLLIYEITMNITNEIRKGRGKCIQHLIQHRKFCMLDEMLDAFERRQILRKMKKEEKNRVG